MRAVGGGFRGGFLRPPAPRKQLTRLRFWRVLWSFAEHVSEPGDILRDASLRDAPQDEERTREIASRHGVPEVLLCFRAAPKKIRGRRESRMPAASDGLACSVWQECTQASFTTGSADIRLSLHDGVFRLAPRPS
jgi:predicted kinase